MPRFLGSQVGLVAMQCTRALFTSANRGNTALQYGVSQLMPELIQFLASAAEAAENTKADDSMVSTTDEVIKILVSFVTSFDEKSSQSTQTRNEGQTESLIQFSAHRVTGIHDSGTQLDHAAESRTSQPHSRPRRPPSVSPGGPGS